MPSDHLTILYGTQTGNAERLAFRVARMALRAGIARVQVFPADDVPIEAWCTTHAGSAMDSSPILFITSNANQGDAPNTFRQTWARLLSPECPTLEGLRYAVFGLGDSVYSRFNLMAKMLHNRLTQLGATPLVQRGLGDESDAKGVDEALLPWLPQLWAALGVSVATPDDGHSKPWGAFDAALFPLYTITLTDAASPCPTQLPFTQPTFRARVAVNRRLTAPDHFQTVHHLELIPEADAHDGDDAKEAEPQPRVVPYTVGDALGVYVPNRAELVDALLERLHLTGEETFVLTADASHGLVGQTKRPFLGVPMSSRTLLTHYFDLDAVTTPECFWMLAECCAVACFTDSADETAAEACAAVQERLMEIATDVNEYLTYAHREKRNICEVLFDFAYLHPSLELVLSFLPIMLPRYFSLSSAPRMDGPRMHLSVAQLAWDTPLKRHRTGLCSTQLVQAALGDHFTCFVWEGTLTPPPSPMPLFLIATGTGVAPIRSIIRQCAAEAGAWTSTPIYLFFGCRNKAKDYIYEEEWAGFKESGQLAKLMVIPAFSRDTPAKVYVQHQIGQHAKAVAMLMSDKAGDNLPTLTYICGNAKSMPTDVLGAITQSCAAVLFNDDEFAARMFLNTHTQQGRFQVDTWSA